MLQSRFFDYIFACSLVKGRLTAVGTGIDITIKSKRCTNRI